MNQTSKNYGGYKNLKSYQMATLAYDLTVDFCKAFRSQLSSARTYDQMVQAARSGKQNIAEGSSASRASRQSEIKLVNVARASFSELLADYEDFLRQQSLRQWDKNSPEALRVRNLHRPNKTNGSDRSDKTDTTDRTGTTYRTYMSDAETAANTLICLINQTTFLLDKQLQALEKGISEKGEVSYKKESYKDYLLRKRKEEDEFLTELSKKYGSEKKKPDNYGQ